MDMLLSLIDIMGRAYDILFEYEFVGVPLLYWSIAFIITNMAISIFWKGAHG